MHIGKGKRRELERDVVDVERDMGRDVQSCGRMWKLRSELGRRMRVFTLKRRGKGIRKGSWDEESGSGSRREVAVGRDKRTDEEGDAARKCGGKWEGSRRK